MLTIMAVAAAGAQRAEELVQQGATEIGYVNFERARGFFRKAVAVAAEGSPVWQQAVFGQAVCAQHISPPTKASIDEAVSLYKMLLEKTPDSPLAARTMMNLGRIAELRDYGGDTPDLEAAREWYIRVRDRFMNEPIAGEATLRIAATYIQTYEPEQVRKGVEILHAWLADHPKDELASAMWQYLADTYFYPLRDYRRSVECYEKADAIGWTDVANKGPIYWRVANLADRFLNDRATAIKYYTKIIRETPNSGKAYESQLALRRLGVPEEQIPRITILKQEEQR